MKGKGLAALIVGSMKPKKSAESDDDEMEDSSEDMDEAKKAAAEEVMAAIKSEDAEALATALADFVEACGGY